VLPNHDADCVIMLLFGKQSLQIHYYKPIWNNVQQVLECLGANTWCCPQRNTILSVGASTNKKEK
jgi:hypothetical protein